MRSLFTALYIFSVMTLSPNDPPLKDIRVLDLSRVLAGPFCSMNLSDLGAEVIKVEIPERGDDTRAYPPFINGVSSYYLSLNRGKKSITIDLKTKEGVRIVHELASKSDVVLENFRPGVTERLNVDYDTLKQINPELIYCSISSFGQTGPYAQWPGYDLIIQGMSGLMGITGEKDGGPMRIGVAVEDINAGLHAVICILAALRVRDMLGIGQYIDLSMLDAGVSWMTYVAGNYFATGNVSERIGTAHPSIVPYQAFTTGDDKYILIAGGNDRLFSILCKILGLEHLIGDTDFNSNEARVEHKDNLIPIIQEALMKKTRDDWLNSLRESGFPCAPVYTIDEVFADPQVYHRNMLVEMEHPSVGTIKQIGTPFKFSESKSELKLPPPELSEHTDEILRELLGYSESEIDALREKGII
jgi:crotonobetainyl-CoA:carnitine CoA-transferase CaiB-like acyl-CoA transferase